MPCLANLRPMAPWTFLTNHAQVLLLLNEHPEARARDLAQRIGITERAVQRIIADLIEAEYLSRTRYGRRNHYEVDLEMALRCPIYPDYLVKELAEGLGAPEVPASVAQSLPTG
jgi:DNA-binding Lrp family transcriptional regulator